MCVESCLEESVASNQLPEVPTFAIGLHYRPREVFRKRYGHGCSHAHQILQKHSNFTLNPNNKFVMTHNDARFSSVEQMCDIYQGRGEYTATYKS